MKRGSWFSEYCKPRRAEGGFTLLEVMVSLVIGTVIAGGVMGSISASLNLTQRIKIKSEIQPVLEAVAQELLTNPERAEQGRVALTTFPNAPPVDILMAPIEQDDEGGTRRPGRLVRVLLQCRAQTLEFTMLIPQKGLDSTTR